MAFLDVSEVLLDPDLTDTFTVLRRKEVVSQQGQVSTVDTPYHNIVGVVVPATPDDLEMLDDNQRTRRTIDVFTRFRLQGSSSGVQPDIIQWRGDSFLVVNLEMNTQFGAGFVKAVCTSIDVQDQPPTAQRY